MKNDNHQSQNIPHLNLWVFAILSCVVSVGVYSWEQNAAMASSDAPTVTTPAPVLDFNKLDPATQGRVRDQIQYCGWCHGPTGVSAYEGAARLAGQLPGYLAEQVHSFKTHTRDTPDSLAIMWNAVDRLDDDIAPYVIDYFSKQKLTTISCPIPWLEGCEGTDAKLAALGKVIYMNGIPDRGVVACQYCHGADAMGNDPVPRLATQRAFYISNQLTYYKEGRRATDPMMPTEAKNLTDDEIQQLANYLGSL